jgi:anti-sigma factor RsiW
MSETGSDDRQREEDLLHAYHDGELSGLARHRFERQLRRQPALRAELSALSGLGERLRALDAEGPSPDLWDDIALRLPAIDARKADSTHPAPRRRFSLAWLLQPAGAYAAVAVAVLAVAAVLMWPKVPQPSRVVRWLDGGGRSVMVIDDVPRTTIIWVLDAPIDEASRGGGREVV